MKQLLGYYCDHCKRLIEAKTMVTQIGYNTKRHFCGLSCQVRFRTYGTVIPLNKTENKPEDGKDG